MEQPEFDPRNSAVVPLPFLDKLLRCYYGSGPKDGEMVQPPVQAQSPASTDGGVGDPEDLRDIYTRMEVPKGFKPGGAALRKIKQKTYAQRDPETTEEQEGTGTSR